MSFGFFLTAAMTVWGGGLQLVAAHAGQDGAFLAELFGPSRVAASSHDTCDVLREQGCVIIFDNRIEVSVARSDERWQEPHGEATSTRSEKAKVRPVARGGLGDPSRDD